MMHPRRLTRRVVATIVVLSVIAAAWGDVDTATADEMRAALLPAAPGSPEPVAPVPARRARASGASAVARPSRRKKSCRPSDDWRFRNASNPPTSAVTSAAAPQLAAACHSW